MAALLAGCLTGPDEAPDSGIYGHAMTGPHCPVESEPPDPSCAPRPYYGDLLVTDAAGSRVVKSFTTGEDGRFNVTLAPGEYAIRDGDPDTFPHCSVPEGSFRVEVRTWTRMDVGCDTGIR